MSPDIENSLNALRESIRKMERTPVFLVVEDNSDDAELLEFQLKDFIPKSQVIVCSSGEAALEVLEKQVIDAIFLDLKLTGMDGIQFMREMKKSCRAVLVIVTGLNGETQSAIEALKLGAVKIIVKPISKDDLRNTFGTI